MRNKYIFQDPTYPRMWDRDIQRRDGGCKFDTFSMGKMRLGEKRYGKMRREIVSSAAIFVVEVAAERLYGHICTLTHTHTQAPLHIDRKGC